MSDFNRCQFLYVRSVFAHITFPDYHSDVVKTNSPPQVLKCVSNSSYVNAV